MSKKLKHKLVNLFLQLYTRRRDFSHSVTAFKQLECSAARFFAQIGAQFCTVGSTEKGTFCTVQN